MQELRLLYFFAFVCIIAFMRITKEKTEYHLGNYLWGSCETDAAVNVSLSHEGCILHALFDVREKELRRMVWESNGPVWTDSPQDRSVSLQTDILYGYSDRPRTVLLPCQNAGQPRPAF